MKNILLIAFLMGITYSVSFSSDKCSIILESRWLNLDNDESKVEQFGGKWILVGHITFKKRCNDIVCMETIRLHWNGSIIDNLNGSLYKQTSYKEAFLPIEENLVCDGVWNKKTQTLIFNFDREAKLGATNIFYLVLTLSTDLESILKNGYFCLDNNCLPSYFKQRLENEELKLMVAGV